MALRSISLWVILFTMGLTGCGREDREPPKDPADPLIQLPEKRDETPPSPREPFVPASPAVPPVETPPLKLKLSISKIKMSAVGTPTFFIRGNNKASLQWIHVIGIHGAVPQGVANETLFIPAIEPPENKSDATRYNLGPDPELVDVSNQNPRLLGEEFPLLPPHIPYWYLKDFETYEVEADGGGAAVQIPEAHIRNQNIAFKLKIIEEGLLINNTLIDYPVFLRLKDKDLQLLEHGGRVRLDHVIHKEHKPNESDAWVTFLIEVIK